MKKLMILGAGIYQVPLIRKAKEMGIYTISVSIPGRYPGFKYADKVYYENTVDCEKIYQIAKDENIDGILTAGTDIAVTTIGYVCDRLGLVGLSQESAEKATNKVLMKECFEKKGVRTARFRKVPFDLQKIKEITSLLNFPLIFKAVDTSGSRGIMKVKSIDCFEVAMNYVREATKLDYFIVEEYLVGEEFGAQAYVKNNKIEFILPHGDYVFTGETGVPIGHYAPYNLQESIIDDIKLQLCKAIEALGLNNCAINADFILVDKKPYVLEIGGRSGATCLAELTSIYYNFDYYEKMIKVALNEPVDFESNTMIANASMLITSKKTGKIKTQKFLGELNENIVELTFDYNVGDNVKAFLVGPDRIGHIITKGKTLDEAKSTLDTALNQVMLEIK